MSDADIYHFGVKGMKWGVRHDRQNKGRDRSRLDSKSTKGQGVKSHWARVKPQTPSKEKRLNELSKNEKKFKDKFKGDSDTPPDESGSKNHWKPSGKQVAVCVIGAALVGSVIYAHYRLGKSDAELNAKEYLSDFQFRLNTAESKARSWDGSGFVKKSSYLQKETTLPVGHTFYRISTTSEHGFNVGTYCTASVDDFNRYVSGFTGEKLTDSFTRISFTATKPIKIPDLNTRLDVLKQVLDDSKGGSHNDEAVLDAYNSLCGGDWGKGLIGKQFFDRLEALGYNAIVDDMDAGVIGDMPLVTFGKNAFSEKTNTVMKPKDFKLAKSALKELLNRK